MAIGTSRTECVEILFEPAIGEQDTSKTADEISALVERLQKENEMLAQKETQKREHQLLLKELHDQGFTILPEHEEPSGDKKLSR